MQLARPVLIWGLVKSAVYSLESKPRVHLADSGFLPFVRQRSFTTSKSATTLLC